MPDSLHELMHPDSMSAMVNRYADQSENRDYIAIYEEGEQIDANVDGSFKWDELRYSRDLAPIGYQDTPSTSGKKLIATPKVGNVFVTQEHVDLPMRFLEGWRNPGSPVANAPEVINNHLRNLTNKVMATENHWAAQSMLAASGSVDLSAFPNSDVPSGTLTYPVQTINALASWATASTAIRSSELNAMKKAYFQNAGFKARRVLASSKADDYLTGNDEISAFMNGGPEAGRILRRSFEEARTQEDAVARFGGLLWAFVENYHALDSAQDTEVDTSPDDDVFALLPGPERSNEAFAIARGVNYVPTGMVAGQVLGAPGNLISAVRGRGAYVELTTAPVGIRLYVFSSLCLVQKMPNAVGRFNMTP